MNQTPRALKLARPSSPGSEGCNGCAVCTLSCPLWRQTHDLLKTFCGRMRSAQGRGSASDMRDSVYSCILCGSCEPVCSFGMDTVARTLELRAEANEPTEVRLSARPAPKAATSTSVLIADARLRSDKEALERALKLVGPETELFEDDGADIADALEAGLQMDMDRLRAYAHALKGVTRIIASDALLLRLLRRLLPGAFLMGIGEAALTHSDIESFLQPGDFYVIDASIYNADHRRLAGFYDELRHRLGLTMNLDLHRVATPTGVLRGGKRGAVDVQAQLQWILEGRTATRIVTERLEDRDVFRQYAPGIPTVYFTEIWRGMEEE